MSESTAPEYHPTTFRRLPGSDQAPLEITFESSGAQPFTLRLNHQAASLLRTMLLASSVARREGESFELAMKPQRVVGFTPFQWGDTLAGLEMRISDQEAMHVCFDAKVGNELLDAVKWFAAHMRDAPGESTKH
ncbi:MAG TPA: hypothetical protein VII68_13145 [Casimicrobiaceae bacterium]|jgi:hypothetical protein